METKSLCTAHQIYLLAQNMTRWSHVCRLVWIQSSCRRPRKPIWSAGRRQMAATAKNCRTTRASRWVWCRRCSVVYTVSFVDSPNTTQSTQLDLQFCFFYTGFSKLPHCLLITKQLMWREYSRLKYELKNLKSVDSSPSLNCTLVKFVLPIIKRNFFYFAKINENKLNILSTQITGMILRCKKEKSL